MTYEYSDKLKDTARIAGLSVEEVIFADLLNAGYSNTDAYNIAFYKTDILLKQTDVQRKAQMSAVLENARFRQFKKGRQKKSYVEKDDTEMMGENEAAREILKVAKNLPDTDKDKGMMFAKYIDVIRKTPDATEGEDSAVRVYVPLDCSRCTLYDKWKKEGNKGEPAKL